MNIGQRIKERRKALKMSADVLAKQLGKDRSTVYRYEKGDIENLPLDILEPIAKALKTTPQYLMGWDNSESDNTTATSTTTGKSGGDLTIGDIIRSLRMERHLSLAECSVELDIPLDEMKRYENGSKQLTASTINTIANFFGLDSVDIAEILLYEFGHDTESLRFRNTHVNRARNWYEEFGFAAFTDEESEQLFQFGRYLLWLRENRT